MCGGMKKSLEMVTSTVIASISLVLISACSGSPGVPVSLTGKWSEEITSSSDEGEKVMNVADTEKESLELSADGTIVYQLARQVGDDRGMIPYPTTCVYKHIGKIIEFTSQPASTAKTYNSVQYKPGRVELVDSKENSSLKDCSAYVQQLNLNAQGGDLYYTIELLEISPTVLVLVRDGERTESGDYAGRKFVKQAAKK